MKPTPSLRIPRRWRRALPVPRGWRGRVELYLRHAASWSFHLLFLTILAGIPLLLVLTSTLGLGTYVKHRAEQALSGSHYDVGLRGVYFNPLRGFILEGLEIRDRTPSHRLLVSADRIALSVNMQSLLRGNPIPERIALRDTTLDIPVGPEETPRMRFEHVSAIILWSADEIRLVQSSFQTAGIGVRVTGSFRNPKAFAPKPVGGTAPGKTADTILAVQNALLSIRWTGARPLLTLEAGGDLGDTESLRVDRALLFTGSGEWRGAPFRGLQASFTFARRRLVMEKLRFDQGAGMLQAAGEADFGGKSGSLEFSGSLGPAGLIRALSGEAAASRWEWTDPVTLSGEASARWGETGGPPDAPRLSAIARVASGCFRYKGVGVRTCSAGIAWRDGKLLLRDFHAEGDPGTLEADLMVAPGDDRVRLKASLHPEAFAPMVDGKAAEALRSLVTTDPLILAFEGWATAPDPLRLRGAGTLELGKASMRESPIRSLTSSFGWGGGAVDFRDIVLRMPEGTASGEFVYDYGNMEGRFPEVRSTADAASIMMWIDPRIAKSIRDYRFVTPPVTRLTGKVGLRDPLHNDLMIEVKAPSGLGYTLIGKNLPFGSTSGTVHLLGQKVLVDLPDSRLFGGGVKLKAEASVAPGDTRFHVTAGVEDVDFRTLTKLYFGYDESGGRLSGSYDFTMTGGDDLSMTGKGNLLIKDGKVLAMLVLGPLSLLLNDIIPGVGYQTAKKATADFTVSEGVIDTRDIVIQGTGFSMLGNGKIHYLEDRMEMNMRLNAQGLPGVVLFPVSKILEYESVGSAKHPKWRPKILPKIGPGSPQATPTPTPPQAP